MKENPLNAIGSVFKTSSSNLNYPKIIEKLFTAKSIEDCEKFLRSNGFEILEPSKGSDLLAQKQISEGYIEIEMSAGLLGMLKIDFPKSYGNKHMPEILDDFVDYGYGVVSKGDVFGTGKSTTSFTIREKDGIIGQFVMVAEDGIMVMRGAGN